MNIPVNGYIVSGNFCSNVLNSACGIRCKIGFNLIGNSIRLCGNEGAWTGQETQCLRKYLLNCGRIINLETFFVFKFQ